MNMRQIIEEWERILVKYEKRVDNVIENTIRYINERFPDKIEN